jgi:hypothetical protein
MPPNYDFHCEQCDSTTIEHFKIAERPATIQCACGGTAKFQIAPTMVMQTALPDGSRRKGWAEMREASKINKAMAVAGSESTKKEMASEIRKLGVSFDGGRGK